MMTLNAAVAQDRDISDVPSKGNRAKRYSPQADAKADPMAAILRLRAHLNPDGAGDDLDWERLEWWTVPARRAAEKAAGKDLCPQENDGPG